MTETLYLSHGKTLTNIYSCQLPYIEQITLELTSFSFKQLPVLVKKGTTATTVVLCQFNSYRGYQNQTLCKARFFCDGIVSGLGF